MGEKIPFRSGQRVGQPLATYTGAAEPVSDQACLDAYNAPERQRVGQLRMDERTASNPGSADVPH
jgi:hypothetical protein